MKKLTILLTAIIALAIASCNDGGKLSKKATTISPASEKINGPLGDYYSVENRNYKVLNNSVVRVEFKRVKDGMPAPWRKNIPLGNVFGCYEPTFTVEFLDEAGNVVGKNMTDVVGQKDELQILTGNKIGESSTVTFHVEGSNVCKFRVNSLFEVHGYEGFVPLPNMGKIDYGEMGKDLTNTPEEIIEQIEDTDQAHEALEEEMIEETLPANNGKDWDKFLDEYEQYVDSYIRLMKKATSGDLSAMTEYVTMLEKAQELSEEIDNDKDEMTPTQMKRYLRITQKMTDAALEMSY